MVYLSIIIGLAFFIGFIIKLNALFYAIRPVECFLAIVSLFSAFYLMAGIGLKKNKQWSISLLRLLSLTWLMGIVEAVFFSILLAPSNFLDVAVYEKYFFAWPLDYIVALHRDFPGLELIPIFMFIPFIVFPGIFLKFCSSATIKNRFKISASNRQNFIIWSLAICLPVLMYFISLLICRIAS